MKKINRLGLVCALLAAVETAGCSGIAYGPQKTTPVSQSCHLQAPPPPVQPARPGPKNASLLEPSGEIMVCPVQITTSALPGGAVGVNYNAVLTATNGQSPYAWAVVGGQLPPGLSLQRSSGQISGTPTQTGAFTFLAQVRDSTGDTASSNFNINTGTSSAPIGASLDYRSGFTSTGLTLNGNAAINGARLRLTDGGTSEASSAFFNTAVNVQSFTNDFSFQITSADADGFTFTIQGNSPTALGFDGGHLGYGPSWSDETPGIGIGKSVAVKFDLYNNAGEGVDSTGLYTNGASPTVPAVDMTSSGVNLHSGDVMNVHMTYDGTMLVMQITDATTKATFSTSSKINIPKTVGGNTAYVGFTGATGGLAAVQDIVNWTYVPETSSSQPVGSSLQITTNALPGGAVGVNYNAGLTASNGVPPYTWGIVGGQLPPGLSLQASTGKILGTPTQAGAFSFFAQVKDSSGDTASSRLSINNGTASAPVVSGVSPNSGATSGGNSVTISGSNFQAGATVLFGGVSASSVTIGSATQIQAVTPAHIAGKVDVTVRNPDGESSTLGSSFVYTASSTVTPITVMPSNQMIPIGGQLQYKAIDNFGNDITSSVVWSSSDSSIASITASGLATGVADGAVTITALK